MSAATVVRSQDSRDGIQSLADELLRASLSRSSSSPSSTSMSTSASTAPPPSYRSPASSVRDNSLNAGKLKPSAGSNVPVVGSSLISSTSSLTLTRKNDSGSVSTPPSRVSAAEAKARVRRLQCEVDRVNEETPRPDTAGLFKTACSTDLLFLLDTTYSMDPYARNPFSFAPRVCCKILSMLSKCRKNARSFHVQDFGLRCRMYRTMAHYFDVEFIAILAYNILSSRTRANDDL